MRRDAGADAVRQRVGHALPPGGEALQCRRRVGAEDLQVDSRPQPELRAGHRGRAAVAAVPDGRDAGGETLGRAETGDVDVLVPADARLALDVQRDPFGEIPEPIPEAAVDGVLDVRVRIDETGQQHRVLVVHAGRELVTRSDSRDPAVLDRYGAVADRRAFDRKHPVGGKDSAHGSLRLAASIRASRRSNTTDNQIESSYRMTSGTISIMVVNGSIPGSATAMHATTESPSRRSRPKGAVDRIPSRVSATTTIGNWKTSAIASMTIVANE